MSRCICKCYLACAVILGSASEKFRHIRALFKSIHAYSEPCVYLVCSEPWHIPITKHIQTSWYIHNFKTISKKKIWKILNIFKKARPGTFDKVLNTPLFYRYYLTASWISTVSWTVSLTLYFRLFSHIYSC